MDSKNEMNFRTEISVKKQNNQMDYNSNIVLFGSCFTENLEQHFNHFKFKNTSNSHGILFHPKAIEKAVEECVENKIYNHDDLSFHDGLWLSYNHHSQFSLLEASQTLLQINTKIKASHNALKTASHVFITLGTSWVYRLLETNKHVANCHKIPQKRFKKEILSVDQIVISLESILKNIQKINSKTIVIFTVSPVRHLRDGFIENTQSKSYLLSAIHQITNNTNTFYFPSYEMMMDDLRDYRFYEKDMIHPNEMALEYIWDVFKNTWIDDKSYEVMKRVDLIQKSLLHKPFHISSEKHQDFLKKLENKIEVLTKEFPQIKFTKKAV